MNNQTRYDFSAQRLFIDHDLNHGNIYSCSPSQNNYLINVLRLKTNSQIFVFNGKDGEWLATIEIVKKNSCQLVISEKVRDQEYGPDIEYLFAPVKRSRLDYMVQKATELGVKSIQPVVTRHTIVDRIKEERLKANVIEAAEQCGILHIPEVLGIEKLEKILDQWNKQKTLIYCDESAPVKNPIKALQSISKGPVTILVGPEGGFNHQEQERLRSLSFVTAISLGPRIMRADTAAVAVLSLVNAVIGDWGNL